MTGKLRVRSVAAKRIGVWKMLLQHVQSTIELVMLTATVVIHCTLIKNRENFICGLVFLIYLTIRMRIILKSESCLPPVTAVCIWRFVFLPRWMECRRGLAMRILSVRPSDKRVICDKTTEWCVQIFIRYERPLNLVFREEEWLAGATASTWNFRSSWLR